MKIGVVSDTHSQEIPPQLLNELKKMDLIIHAGDFCTAADLDTFKRLGEVKAVYGNMDGEDLREVLPRRQIIEADGVTIGVFHGEGSPEQLLEVVQKEFKGTKVDAVVFGHSHQPMNERIDKILFFNPGSPNDLVFAPYRSYGILEIKAGKITGKIVRIK